MQEHSWNKHAWKSANIGGRPERNVVKSSPEVPWRSGVHYQRFFAQGPKSGYFEVMRDQEHTQVAVAEQSPYDQLQSRIAQGFERVEAASIEKIKATDESREPNPWLRRVGWARHLSGLERTKLRALVRPVEAEEPVLEAIHEAFRRLIRRAQETGVVEVLGQAALFEAERKDIKKKATKPFNSRMDKTTFQQYT
jgi:hypothetical protein